MYQWIMRRKGYEVSDTGYFVYVDGQHVGEEGMIDNNDPAQAWMRFNTAVIPYVGNDSWVEAAIFKAKETVLKPFCPEHAEGCEYKGFLDGVKVAIN